MKIPAFVAFLALFSSGLAGLPTAQALSCDQNFNRDFVTYEICKAAVDGEWEPLRQWVQARHDEAHALADWIIDVAFATAGAVEDLAWELVLCLLDMGPCPS